MPMSTDTRLGGDEGGGGECGGGGGGAEGGSGDGAAAAAGAVTSSRATFLTEASSVESPQLVRFKPKRISTRDNKLN